MNQSASLFDKVVKIQIRDFDPVVAEAELRLRITDIKAAIARLDEAQLITQETMQLYFNICWWGSICFRKGFILIVA